MCCCMGWGCRTVMSQWHWETPLFACRVWNPTIQANAQPAMHLSKCSTKLAVSWLLGLGKPLCTGLCRYLHTSPHLAEPGLYLPHTWHHTWHQVAMAWLKWPCGPNGEASQASLGPQVRGSPPHLANLDEEWQSSKADPNKCYFFFRFGSWDGHKVRQFFPFGSVHGKI